MPVGSLDQALSALRQGLIVGVPTDTVYGIAVDPHNEQAVARLFVAKGRPEVKPIPVLAADFAAATALGVVPSQVSALWPGALTVIVRRRPGLPQWVGDSRSDTIGLRVPDHDGMRRLLALAGPLAVTSANLSGAEPAADAPAAEAMLGESVACYLPGAAGRGEPSTVVHLAGERPRVLRHGPVDWPEE